MLALISVVVSIILIIDYPNILLALVAAVFLHLVYVYLVEFVEFDFIVLYLHYHE